MYYINGVKMFSGYLKVKVDLKHDKIKKTTLKFKFSYLKTHAITLGDQEYVLKKLLDPPPNV